MRKHRLIDCNPHWVVLEENGPECGIHFDCPEGHAGCSHTIPFRPTLDGLRNRSWRTDHVQWQRAGDTFETLTLTPSIKRQPQHADREAALKAGCLAEYITEAMFCALHVNIVNGAIEFCGDSK